MLITLYGINNIGKTTHTERLVERLLNEGHDAVRVKYPVYDSYPSGMYLNTLLRGEEVEDGSSNVRPTVSEAELQLWFVINRYQFEPTLRRWLDEGKIVVAEDYIGTGIAWGTAKGVPTDWLESLNQGLIQEDLSILIDGERVTKAIESGHLHEEDHDLVTRCREVHLELAERYDWEVVELQAEKEDTFELIWEKVEPHLSN